MRTHMVATRLDDGYLVTYHGVYFTLMYEHDFVQTFVNVRNGACRFGGNGKLNRAKLIVGVARPYFQA